MYIFCFIWSLKIGARQVILMQSGFGFKLFDHRKDMINKNVSVGWLC
jgi:hypothetical protein